jgi:hypothetical protein
METEQVFLASFLLGLTMDVFSNSGGMLPLV